ncbi:hypothetical protein F4804DRAFT_285930 [Jackrogersella minutella]|nr:hypothetical protein F4804DRAFT_285930 [Jackrogersella minutella]
MDLKPQLPSYYQLVSVSDVESQPNENTSIPPPVIRIFHPGYPEIYSPLLQFVAWDDGGVDYNIVYHACCIIVQCAVDNSLVFTATAHLSEPNSLSPYLSLAKEPEKPIPPPTDGILREKKYFLHLPRFPGRYPVIPNFSNWVFPHDDFPTLWKELPISPLPDDTVLPSTTGRPAVVVRDRSCRFTKSLCGTRGAHIVPKKDNDWFFANHMGQYCDPSSSPSYDDMRNMILLRADVHKMFDDKELVVVPKFDKNNTCHLVTHVLKWHQQSAEIKTLFHNRTCYGFTGVSPECLYARFAWSIFNSSTFRFFESQPEIFSIRIRDPNASPGSIRYIDRDITSSSQIPRSGLKSDAPSKSERATSNKRKRGVGHYSVSQERVMYSSDDEDSLHDGSSEGDHDSDVDRGRKRE